jgi:hypothetical protein
MRIPRHFDIVSSRIDGDRLVLISLDSGEISVSLGEVLQTFAVIESHLSNKKFSLGKFKITAMELIGKTDLVLRGDLFEFSLDIVDLRTRIAEAIRFSVSVMEVAQRSVEAILHDMSTRTSLDWASMTPQQMDQVLDTWRGLIMKEFNLV